MIEGDLSRICGMQSFERPMPVVDEVWVSVWLGGDPRSDGLYRRYPASTPALLDTGATRSVIPSYMGSYVRRAPHKYTSAQSCDFEPNPRPRPCWFVTLFVHGINVKLMAMGANRSNVILGQDFLQGLALLMDTTCGKWRVGRPRRPATISTRIALRLFGLE